VILNELDSCNAVAYDWMGHNLFWTKSNLNMISVVKLTNTTLKKVLIRDPVGEPKSIALDPHSGMMYWATWASHGKAGKIEYAWMDGTNRLTLADSKVRNIHWPSGLTIDFVERKLYWCDIITPSISRIGLDGNDFDELYALSKNFFPTFVTFHDQHIFWTDRLEGDIERLYINNKSA